MTTYRNLLLLPFSLLLLMASGVASTNQWPSNQVSGTIKLHGKPLAGVVVTAYNTNTSSITQVTKTDESGNYSLQLPAWINTAGTASADYHIWAMKAGYGFYPSVPSGAAVTRADHTGDFAGNGFTDIAIYFTVIHYVALPNLSDRGVAGPPLRNANFTAYDGSNPLIGVVAENLSTQKAFAGQGRFTDHHDGTVTDKVTGLVWLKDAGCFQSTTWAKAVAEVHALASGACGLSDKSIAGDWRLPNINELESLVDVSASNPAVTPGSPFTNVSTAIYWSSTSYFGGESGSPNAWAIHFADGRYINDGTANNKGAYNEVWAVKGTGTGPKRPQSTGQYVTFTRGDDGSIQSGVPLTFPRWVDKNDGTVADTVTGLVWLKRADCIHETWEEAVAAVKELSSGQCGLTDGSKPGNWRMPSRNEVESLSDRMENNHADFFSHTYRKRDNSLFQESIFNNFIPSEYYWSSTLDAADAVMVWTVFSCDFGVYDKLKVSVGYTLAVRSPR